ncbi:hypothetical protein B2G71_06375 [Novosphingobium sp. PC22D]|uniref:nuclear transport factor 2 family protein n=1 Tax=Novosphingobium sp. PC22D TaxID=1962403 RepID=UPI000BF08650|nr:nuclear transport factor 2 family protein [Novosphingobium sp. PC22D]PEQ13922.1 hypothetical protein B2G71_06375 [Novosphingobium sp. PC22D]
MTSQEQANIALVKRFYQYLEDGDRDGAYANVIDPDCELHECAALPYGGVYKGRERMKAVLQGVMAGFDEFTCEIRNYLAGGDEVVCHLLLSGVGRESRKPFTVPVMELWRIRDGKVVELRPFLFEPDAIAGVLA